jgi:hypothetical protein
MSVRNAYKNYLKKEQDYEDAMSKVNAASSTSGSGLLSPRRKMSKMSTSKNNNSKDKNSSFKSVYDAVQAIRNRNA